MNKLAITITSVVFLLGIFLGLSEFYRHKEAEKLAFMAEKDFATFVRPHSPRMGNQNSKVFLVEFLDPECESCREFYPVVKQILKDHEGQLQLVVRYAPFHRNSVFVIKILEASKKQNKYWETLDLLFRSQPYWGNHHNPQPELIWQYLPSIGVDIDSIKTDMEDPAIVQLIEQDKQDGLALNIRGTPTFFINGQPLQKFGKEPLEEAVKKAISEFK